MKGKTRAALKEAEVQPTPFVFPEKYFLLSYNRNRSMLLIENMKQERIGRIS
jgi:hypothetical protein